MFILALCFCSTQDRVRFFRLRISRHEITNRQIASCISDSGRDLRRKAIAQSREARGVCGEGASATQKVCTISFVGLFFDVVYSDVGHVRRRNNFVINQQFERNVLPGTICEPLSITKLIELRASQTRLETLVAMWLLSDHETSASDTDHSESELFQQLFTGV